MIDIELKSNKKIINLKTLEWIYSGNMVRAGVNKVIDEHQLAPQPEMICRTARPFEALTPPLRSSPQGPQHFHNGRSSPKIKRVQHLQKAKSQSESYTVKDQIQCLISPVRSPTSRVRPMSPWRSSLPRIRSIAEIHPHFR